MQAGPRWRGRFAFSQGSQAVKGLLPPMDGTGNPAADYSIDEISPNQSVSAAVDVTPSRWLFVSARTGYFFKNLYNRGVYRGDRFQLPTSSVGSLGCRRVPAAARLCERPVEPRPGSGKGPRLGAQIDGTLFFCRGRTAPAQVGRAARSPGARCAQRGDGQWDLRVLESKLRRQRGPLGYYRVTSNDREPNLGVITQGDATVNNVGLFLQDDVDDRPAADGPPRHADRRRKRSVAFAGPPFSEDRHPFRLRRQAGPAPGPRLGRRRGRANQDLRSWGVFYDITKLQMSFGFGGFSSVGYVYTLDDGDISRIVDNPDCPPACPGTLIDGGSPRPANDPDDNPIDPASLRCVFEKPWSAWSVNRLLSSRRAPATFTNRLTVRSRTWVRVDGRPEPLFFIANPGLGAASFYPGEDPPRCRSPGRADYDALEVGLDRRLSGGWAARAAYTWSRL